MKRFYIKSKEAYKILLYLYNSEKMTIRSIAHSLGVNPSTVSRWFSGNEIKYITESNFSKLCKIYSNVTGQILGL